MSLLDSITNRWIVAIDGGGSKVAGAIAPLNATGCFEISQAIPYSVRLKSAGVGSAALATWKDARINLVSMLDNLLDQAGANSNEVAHAVLMLAGAGRPADVQRVTESLLERASFRACAQLTVTSDIGPLIQYACDLDPKSPAIVVIAGTGSLVGAIDTNRNLIRAGGWGPVLGDDASGWRIALGALKPICMWIDRGNPNEEPPEALEIVSKFLSEKRLLPDRDQLNSALIALAGDRHLAAQLAPEILKLSTTTEGTATYRFVRGQFWLLVKQIEDVHQRLGVNSDWRLCLAGGLASNDPLYQDFLKAELELRRIPPVSITVLDPVEAGLRFATRT
ncbi:MAG: BadF/BadG/BcrA/BcrD ATPase family protein [Pirellulaceae bacterium]|nr:BadF/BadG/BcrA/BcrD ATPase family protein [Pirellulaceae bacterium]